MNMKKLESTLRMLLRDAQTHERMIREALAYVRAGADAGAGAGTPTRVVNTQNSNNTNCPTVIKNKQTKTCESVCVTGSDTQNTRTQFLSLDFIQSHLPNGVPAWYATYWHALMEQRCWQMRDGKRVNSENWPYFLGAFFARATDEELAAAQKCEKTRPRSPAELAAIRKRLLDERESLWGKGGLEN